MARRKHAYLATEPKIKVIPKVEKLIHKYNTHTDKIESYDLAEKEAREMGITALNSSEAVQNFLTEGTQKTSQNILCFRPFVFHTERSDSNLEALEKITHTGYEWLTLLIWGSVAYLVGRLAHNAHMQEK